MCLPGRKCAETFIYTFLPNESLELNDDDRRCVEMMIVNSILGWGGKVTRRRKKSQVRESET